MNCQLDTGKNSIINSEGWYDTVKPLKKTISIVLDEPILVEVRRLAEQDDRSVSSYINLVLKEHLGRISAHQADPSIKQESGNR